MSQRPLRSLRSGDNINGIKVGLLLPATRPMRWIMTCNGANVWLLPAVQHALTWPRNPAEKRCNHPESESLFKRRSLVNCDSRGQVRRKLTPVLWEKWKECASCFLELCKSLHSRNPEHFPQRSWYALSVLESLGKGALIGDCLPRSVAPDVQRRFRVLPAILSKRINSKWASMEILKIAASPCTPYSLIRRFAVIAEPEGF
jgi:hypothetical protein